VPEHPFEPFGSEFRRAMEEFGTRLNEEMKRVQREIEGAVGGVAAELQRVMEELHRERDDRPNFWETAVNADRDDRTARRAKPVSKKKRPRRRPPGSATAPVKPKPKPTPLKDGAEAPVE
jgi:hypothetical protein